MKRPRAETPYKVTVRVEEEQRQRAFNLDRILKAQCQGTPVVITNAAAGQQQKVGGDNAEGTPHRAGHHSSDSEAAGESS